MKNKVGNYTIEMFANGDLQIDYARSLKDFFYSFVYLAIAVPIIIFDYKMTRFLVQDTFDFNSLFGYFFAIFLFLAGLYFFGVSVETMVKPTRKVFFINAAQKQLVVKTNRFNKLQFDFNEIKQFNLGAKTAMIVNKIQGRTHKKQLFLIQMDLELMNNHTVKIHQFESTHLIISSSENEKKQALKQGSKQITMTLANQCGKNFSWKPKSNL